MDILRRFFSQGDKPTCGDIRLTLFLLAICAFMWWAGQNQWLP